MGTKVDRLGPGFAQEGIIDGANDPGGGGRAAVDGSGFVDGAERAHGRKNRLGEAGAMFRVEFVEIEACGLPVLVNAEREIERGLTFQPGDVCSGLSGAEVEVVAVEVEPGRIFPRAAGETIGVKLGANEPRGAGVKSPGLDHGQQGQGWGGFVAVHSGGEVNPGASADGPFGQGDQGMAINLAIVFDAETGQTGG